MTITDRTPEEIVAAAIEILQKNLPPGGVADRDTISELWGVLDSPDASKIYAAHPEQLKSPAQQG